jgi:hypothetical protein
MPVTIERETAAFAPFGCFSDPANSEGLVAQLPRCISGENRSVPGETPLKSRPTSEGQGSRAPPWGFRAKSTQERGKGAAHSIHPSFTQRILSLPLILPTLRSHNLPNLP